MYIETSRMTSTGGMGELHENRTQGSRTKTLYDILDGAAVGTRFIGKQQVISRLERRAQ